MKANFHTNLEAKKQLIDKLQTDIESAKKLYAKALANLEGISVEIHEKRQQRTNSIKLGQREAGVGSESPVPPPKDTKPGYKAINNNEEQEAEIIISFPPAAQIDANCQPADSAPKTISMDYPDEPINISGIQINVTPSAAGAPAIVVNGVEASDEELDDAKVANEQSDSPSSTYQQSDNTPLSNQQSDNNSHLAGNDNRDHHGLDAFDKSGEHSDSGSINTSPVTMRHRRIMSGSIKLSAKRLLHETSSLDSDSGSVCSFVGLDDNGVANALSQEYFTSSIKEELRRSTHEDYSKLPQSLARYQRPYETTRMSSTSFPPLDDAELKLEQVLKLLESVDGESIV